MTAYGFYRISTGRKDVSLFALLWCSGVVGDILGDNSRFDVFDSRLRPSEFPFSPATGIDRQAVDFSESFSWGE
jgi:hypothetical protein